MFNKKKKKMVVDDNIWSVWSFLDFYIFFLMHSWLKGQITDVSIGSISETLC